MELIEFIKVYDNVLTKEQCHKCIEIFEEGVESEKEKLDNHCQKFTQYWISKDGHGELFNDIKNRISYFQSIYQAFLMDGLGHKFISSSRYEFEKFKIKKYVPELKEEFRRHTDSTTKRSCRRFLSSLIYLNDVEEGGQTAFNDVTVNPKEGRLIIFPPLWMFPHAGKMPVSDIKYILTTYLRYTV